MRLNFNETNVLIQSINDLVKYNKPVNKSSLINMLDELSQNTDTNHLFLHQSIKTLISKIEMLSDDIVNKIYEDVQNDRIIATACYQMPQH